MSSRALLAALLALGGCKSQPATILLRISARPEVPALDELRLTVFTSIGVEVSARRLPVEGKPTLPGEVVLYPRDTSPARVLVRGEAAGAVAGEGATQVEPRVGEQVEASVQLVRALPDRDGDGVPDAIDNCPDLPNPKQEACRADAAVDARRDQGLDLRAEAGADSRLDALPDLDCDHDGDGHRAKSCGGDDCDDSVAAVHPGVSEGPPGAASCSDGIDNDCDGATDLVDTGCKACNLAADCDDKNPCTSDACLLGLCKNTALTGTSCDDGDACTTGTSCQSTGLCGGGSQVSCPPPSGQPCKQASCDPKLGCVTSNKPDGASCDDNLFCTDGDACSGGSCVSKPRDCAATAPPCRINGSCSESGKQCSYTTAPDGQSCEDGDSCTGGETCKTGSCRPASQLIEALDISVRNPRALVVDSKGKLHTVYRGVNTPTLRYATNSLGPWQVSIVDTTSPSTGHWASIAIDPQDGLHLSYEDEAKNQLRYGYRPAGGVWQLQSIDGTDGHTSIAVEASGRVHISHRQSQDLRYATSATPTSGNWQKQQVAKGTGTFAAGIQSSLVLGAGGMVYIAHGEGTTPANYYEAQINLLRLSEGTASTSWTTSSPSGISGAHGAYPSIALGGAGEIHIVHTTTTGMGTQGTLYLSTRAGAVWTTQTIGDPLLEGGFSSTLVDSSGRIQICYRQAGQSQLRHVLIPKTGAPVIRVLAEVTASSLAFPSIATRPGDPIHLVFEVGPAGASSMVRYLALCP